MATVRDWTKTLWAASYKGFPFYFDRDEEEGGRGIVIHKFPMRDDPFNEDLGEEPRYFSGSAYISGDDADTATANFVATLVSAGPGPLVIPIYGPINCRLLTFKRISEKDRLGYIAFDVRFVREGAATALISIPYLGQLAIGTAGALAAVIVTTAPAALSIADQPEYVAAAAATEFATAAAALDAVRTSYPVDATVSETVAGQVQAIVNAAPLLIDPAGPNTSDVAALAAAMAAPLPPTAAQIPAASGAAALAAAQAIAAPTMTPDDGVRALTGALVQATLTLAAGMTAPIGAGAMGSLIDFYAPETEASIAAALSANAATASANVTGAQQLARLAALTAWANAVVATTYSDRPQGVTARAEAAERFEIELNNCPGAAYAALYLALEQLQGGVVSFLTQLIANLAPVVTVEARMALPSLVWAWTLYQDPTRCVDLVLRNSVRHPSFMPREFAALAPGYQAPGLATAWPAPPL